MSIKQNLTAALGCEKASTVRRGREKMSPTITECEAAHHSVTQARKTEDSHMLSRTTKIKPPLFKGKITIRGLNMIFKNKGIKDYSLENTLQSTGKHVYHQDW